MVVGSNPATPTIFLQRALMPLLSMHPLLKIDHLSCERNDVALFHDLSFEIYPGDIVHIVGRNGCGKTTLIRIIANFERTARSEITREKNLDKTTLYIGHQSGIKDQLTPLENLRWYFPLSRDDQIVDALTGWDLSGYENTICGRLSAGQKQRVALARLCLAQDRFWILDEPFVSLDASGVSKLEAMLGRHAEKNGAVILTTHHRFQGEKKPKIVALCGDGV